MYLYGASGHAKVILDILKAQNVEVEGLIDDNPEINQLLGLRVFHGERNFSPIIISIGNNPIRKAISEQLTGKFAIAIHPTAILSDFATLGEGTVVMQGSIVQSCVKIGRHCIVNTGASVDHDCRIGDFVHISPHSTLCGNVTVGEGTWIGAGSIILPGVQIGKWSVIGAGSVICEDIPDRVLVVGNRCKVIKSIEQ